VPTAVVDGNARRWKVRVSERAHGDAHRLIVTVFGVEDGSSTNRAEPEYELGSLIPDSNVLGGGTEDLNGTEKVASAAKTLPVLCWQARQ
jgi:hypothetical protein